MLALSKTINRPSVSISAVALAVWLGAMDFPFLKYLQPLGDMYVGLMQMCVLPFLFRPYLLRYGPLSRAAQAARSWRASSCGC